MKGFKKLIHKFIGNIQQLSGMANITLQKCYKILFQNIYYFKYNSLITVLFSMLK